jgi:hypothetical protein
MVMRAMLIGVLVIGAVAILETDANAWYHCFLWPCIELTPRELDKVVSEVKKYERSEVWLIGFTNRGPRSKSKEFDRVSRKMEDVRETLIQRGLQPGIFRGLILEGYAPRNPKWGGIKVIVAWPPNEQYKR